MIDGFQGEHRFLSNFWPSPIELNDIVFPTVEHAYQAAKYRLGVFDRLGLQASMAACPSPAAAKRRGRSIELRHDWTEAKLAIMHRLLRLKFAADSDLAARLLATEDQLLVERNDWSDTIWGVCNGVGENYLGKLLMLVRDELRARS